MKIGRTGLAVVIAWSALQGMARPARAADSDTPVATEQIKVKARRLLLKQKNSPSAVTELGKQQIAQEGTMGSTSTLLRQAPSIYV